ncbi:hypothetical protein [Actinomadura chokoriensis]|uniref:Lipoprotein n=1 Tax=Actinomadura chokoriensis TaxID=454156 RepID=A0ABV4QTE8_9ACTN
MRASAFLYCVLATLSLAACGEGGSPDPGTVAGTGSSAASSVRDINQPHYRDKAFTLGGPAEVVNGCTRFAADFNREGPLVKVPEQIGFGPSYSLIYFNCPDDRKIRFQGIDEGAAKVSGELDKAGCHQAVTTLDEPGGIGGNISLSETPPGTMFCLSNQDGSRVTFLKLTGVDKTAGSLRWTATHWSNTP